MAAIAIPPSPLPGLTSVVLDTTWEPVLQRFFEANPEYFFATTDEAPKPGDAHGELHDRPPQGWPYGAVHLLGYAKPSGELAALVSIVSDLLATGIWHIGLFIVETARHGGGDAGVLYRDLEQWAARSGARWLRLGVVQGNRRAERFWERQGYRQTRLRHGVAMGSRTNTIRVMCKSLAAEPIDQYLRLVERDRPEASD